MFRNINDIKAFRLYQKTKVILFILILIVPFSFFLLYFDALFTFLLLNSQDLSILNHLFEFSWWRIMIFIFIQYSVLLVLGSILYYTTKIIIKEKDWFLS